MSIGTWLTAADATTYAARLAADGAGFCWSSARRGQTGLTPPYNWTALDAEIAALQAAGLAVGLKIQNWEDDEEYPRYPTSESDYTDWLTALAARYVPLGVTRCAIENEVSTWNAALGHAFHWQGSLAEYGDLLDLAYPVLSSGGMTVSESTFGSAGLQIVYLRGLYDAENMSAADDLAYQVWLHHAGEQWQGAVAEPPWDEAGWTAFWAMDGVQNALDAWTEIQAHGASFDALGIHWYGVPAPWMRLTLAYIRAWFPTKTITCWELGYTWSSLWGALDETVLTNAVATLMIAALGNGATEVAWFPYLYRAIPGNPNRYHPGLLDATGAPRPADAAFRTVIQHLAGVSETTILDWGETVEAYQFIRYGHTVYAAWATSGTVSVMILDWPDCLVTSTRTGRVRFAKTLRNLVEVTTEPVFIEAIPVVLVRP